MTIDGECFCGEITYKIAESIQNPTMCHCSRCRKAFGGSGSVFSVVDSATFIWQSGEEDLQAYIGKKGWGIGFCRKCGTTLCGIYNGKVVGIDVGTLNDNLSISVREHIYVGSKASWDHIGGEAPQFEEAAVEK